MFTLITVRKRPFKIPITLSNSVMREKFHFKFWLVLIKLISYNSIEAGRVTHVRELLHPNART